MLHPSNCERCPPHNHLFWTRQPSHFTNNMLPGFPIHHPILLAVLRLQRAPKQEKQPLLEQQPSWLTWLESDAHYPQEYGRVFNSFNRKRLKCVLLVHFSHINQNWFRLKRLAPIEHDLSYSHSTDASLKCVPFCISLANSSDLRWVSNFDMPLVVGLIPLVEEIIFMLIKDCHNCIRYVL